MKNLASLITRRSLLSLMAAAAMTGPANVSVAGETTVTVHKDPNCGCCAGWVQHLRDAGFTVQVKETTDLEAVRSRLGIPPDLAACHTAEVGGYLVEGHVPAPAVRSLPSERPHAKGLAVPGMPVGSPGMEGGQPQTYTVVLFGADSRRPFMRFIGKQPIG